MTPDLVRRLGLFQELSGHTGCVNCIQWNTAGTLLASGSDDRTIIVWDGVRCKRVERLETPHEGNIFSVVWLPGSEDGQLVSGAGDCRVCLADLEAGAVTRNVMGHQGRVKRLAVAGDAPGVVWSGGEDGLVRQWDTRERWTADSSNVLINLTNQAGRSAEVKCLAICPSRPELVAVGANDPYVRVYDRRSVSCSAIDTSCEPSKEPSGAVAYFVPGHLPGSEVKFHRRMRPLASTYIAYNCAGTELVCNLGGEQVYLYDRWALYCDKGPEFRMAVINDCDIPRHEHSPNNENKFGQLCVSKKNNVKPLSKRVENFKMNANKEFEDKNFSAAVSFYNQALVQHGSGHPILLGNRAASLMKRAWDGDTYAALRDCLAALSLDPDYVKAHLRMTQCLLDLEWITEAANSLKNFKTRHREFVQSKAFIQLQTDLESAKDKLKGKSVKSSPLKPFSSPGLSQYSASDFLRGRAGHLDDNSEDLMDIQDSDDEEENSFISSSLSLQEKSERSTARDYSMRYLGACNTTTDIKEANFLGSGGQYIMAGSDDGKFFIWDRKTANIERVLEGDDNIVNCLQSHPHSAILATSGIDPVVRIWQPLPENGAANDRIVDDLEAAATSNQRRMNADPFENLLMGMGYRMNVNEENQNEGDNDGSVQCRPS